MVKKPKREQGDKLQPRHTLTVMEGREKNIAMVQGFAEAALRRGWGFLHLMNINSDSIARYAFDDLKLDYVIFRHLAEDNYYEIDRVLQWLQRNSKLCLNADITGGRASTSDKHFQQGLFMLDPILKQYALPTFEAKFKANTMSYIHGQRVHFPIVLKPRQGTTGTGIKLIRNESELSQISNLRSMLIEQYIEPECDFRVFVIGGVAVGTMRKTGNTDDYSDFKSWCSGEDRHLEEDPEVLDILSEIATRAASISRLGYTGVDILRAKATGEYYILETNIAAGWLNFAHPTGISIPDLTLDWFEDVESGRKKSFPAAIEQYLIQREKYLPIRIQRTLDDIAKGKPNVLEPYQHIFDTYPQDHLYDAGYLFNRLAAAYNEITQNPDQKPNREKLKVLIDQIELTPFSWAGNFIGPEVGTFHDGAILSALYLYLRRQLTSEKPHN